MTNKINVNDEYCPICMKKWGWHEALEHMQHAEQAGIASMDEWEECDIEETEANPVLEVDYSGDYVDRPLLLCPICKFEYVHIKGVATSTRLHEDGEESWSYINRSGEFGIDVNWAMSGELATLISTNPRRYAFTLIGECESGCQFGIGFVQHKGWTFVEINELTRRADPKND